MMLPGTAGSQTRTQILQGLAELTLPHTAVMRDIMSGAAVGKAHLQHMGVSACTACSESRNAHTSFGSCMFVGCPSAHRSLVLTDQVDLGMCSGTDARVHPGYITAVAGVEERIAAWTLLPATNGEGLQVGEATNQRCTQRACWWCSAGSAPPKAWNRLGSSKRPVAHSTFPCRF
jgi:hypothetical protein